MYCLQETHFKVMMQGSLQVIDQKKIYHLNIKQANKKAEGLYYYQIKETAQKKH